jgi:DNA-binding MarR family transcriptional regulator
MRKPSGSDVTASDFRALSEFRYQIRRYLAFSDAAAEAEGLPSRQYQLLLSVKGLPEGIEPTIRNLAERLDVRHHSAVELVDRLEKRGFVKRERSKTHRSFVFVRVTKEGEKVLKRLVASRKADLATAGPILVKTLTTLTKRGRR